MVQPRIRTFAFALALSVVAPAAVGFAQTTAAPQSSPATGGVTGTDPCPKNYICTTSGKTATPTSGGSATTTSTSSGATSTMMQAILSLLGKS